MRAGKLVWCTVVAVYAAIIGLAWQQGYLSQPPERSLRDDYQDVPRAYSDLTPDEFVELFDGLIFTTESGRHLPSLVRWEQRDLTFAVAGQTDRDQLVEVRRFVETLSVLMDRSFAEIGRATEADITIQFGSRRRLRQRSDQLLSSDPGEDVDGGQGRRAVCWAVVSSMSHRTVTGRVSRRPPQIVRAWAFIPDDLPQTTTSACIVEELSHAVGVQNDLPWLHSVFSDEIHVSVLTETDRAIIRALYNHRLHSGMPRARVLKAVRDWFEEDRRRMVQQR